jgi:hypothetical protein
MSSEINCADLQNRCLGQECRGAVLPKLKLPVWPLSLADDMFGVLSK